MLYIDIVMSSLKPENMMKKFNEKCTDGIETVDTIEFPEGWRMDMTKLHTKLQKKLIEHGKNYGYNQHEDFRVVVYTYSDYVMDVCRVAYKHINRTFHNSVSMSVWFLPNVFVDAEEDFAYQQYEVKPDGRMDLPDTDVFYIARRNLIRCLVD